jgi:hypothetical protein
MVNTRSINNDEEININNDSVESIVEDVIADVDADVEIMNVPDVVDENVDNEEAVVVNDVAINDGARSVLAAEGGGGIIPYIL